MVTDVNLFFVFANKRRVGARWDEQGVFPRETSFLSPPGQVENCPGRKMNIEQYRIIIEVIESLSGRDRIIISQSIETPRRG